MRYHFRDILGTKFRDSWHDVIELDVELPHALFYAYALSAQCNQGVIVCTSSEVAGNAAFTEIASVRVCK